MAIDGRTLKPQQPQVDAATAAYQSKGVGLVAALIIWVPLGGFLVFTYWTGTFFGGIWGGILSVITTAGSIAGMWFFKKHRQHG